MTIERLIHGAFGRAALLLVTASSVLHAGTAARLFTPAQAASASSAPSLPRGKKLILKDGTFQVVREYQVNGDRVRYYSLDSSQWEEMPASLVDWDATKKAETQEAQQTDELVRKIDKQQLAQQVNALDVDASLEAAPGIFLPPGVGVFEFDGRTIRPLTEANQDESLDKTRVVEKVLSPVPLVPSRHTIWIGGSRSHFRIKNQQPEFYMRTADGHEPELLLIRTKVKGDRREVENIDVLFGEARPDLKTLPVMRWEMARGVYRFTVTQPLGPGEYGLVEVAKTDTPSFFIWDFGIDRNAGPAPTAASAPGRGPRN